MANIKISDLTAAASASGTQEFEVNDSLTSKKVTGAQLKSYVLPDGDKGDITTASGGTSWTIDNGVVTTAKMADMATASVLGRNTAGTGAPEVLSASTARTLIGADNASNLTSGTVGTARLASGTASSSTYLRGDQTWATVGSYAGLNSQLFTSSGTFTVPAGITSVVITVVGGGGGGGGCVGSACGATEGGIGGFGGSSIAYVTGLTPGGTISITVGSGGSAGASGGGAGGTGGTSSAASYASATGGTGGNYNSSGGAASPGTGSLGRFNSRWATLSNDGGNLWGYVTRRTTNGNGVAGTGYGAGGGNGWSNNNGNKTGGAGAGGMVMVEW